MNRPPLRPAMTREQLRAVDRVAIERFHIPGVVLMENAGRGAAELLTSFDIDGPVAICCGKGNNGGDGFVIARHLAIHGHDIRILLFCDPRELAGDAGINYRIVEASGIPLREFGVNDFDKELTAELRNCSWIVDALLGTGATGAVREPVPRIVDAINQSSAKVLAVDLPSGMDCDTGKPLGCCVHASHTATFVATKPGFENADAREFTGEVHVIDIGVPNAVLNAVRDNTP